jgi:hypothetical protein
MSVRLTPPADSGSLTSAGFRFGIRGLLEDYQHVLVLPKQWVDAAVSADGHLVLDGETSADMVPVNQPIALELRVDQSGAELKATGGGTTASIRKPLAAARVPGNIALMAAAPAEGGQPADWRFQDWKAGGPQLEARPDQTFGPILWTQYALSRGVLKLTALFAPIGRSDSQTTRLEVNRNGKWMRISEHSIDPLSRTATFRVAGWDATVAVAYRVVYRWQGRDHAWTGTIRQEPSGGVLKIGVLSCDNGYVFPLTRLVNNVKVHDPDLLFFAGDQIYEAYGGFGIVREPVDVAMLDYLRKFWQFGWTWRELLRDRPSIVIPDDHDVYQGNIWGQGGRKIPKGREQGFTYGGYVEPADWVNAVQRTQSAHLPDPVDPAPVEQGITVYFTELIYGGVSFAIIEDRKFKTGPESAFAAAARPADPAKLDAPGAELLGRRQEEFLRRWARQRDGAFKVVLSQTIFCKVTTHSGAQLRPAAIDLDCGGWPQSGRRRALEAILPANALMIHGDQHIGALVHHGLDGWEDGPIAFMVPGTANGFPRAWWPEGERADGRHLDGLGNRITVLAVANPDKGSNELPRATTNPEELAHRKGSGYGVVRFDQAAGTITFDTWRYLFDAASPKASDQFTGFPRTIRWKARTA